MMFKHAHIWPLTYDHEALHKKIVCYYLYPHDWSRTGWNLWPGYRLSRSCKNSFNTDCIHAACDFVKLCDIMVMPEDIILKKCYKCVAQLSPCTFIYYLIWFGSWVLKMNVKVKSWVNPGTRVCGDYNVFTDSHSLCHLILAQIKPARAPFGI